MTTSHTLTIAVDDPFAIYRRAPSAPETRQPKALVPWNRLQHLIGAFLRGQAHRTRPLSGYYLKAQERVSAAAPVTSLRPFA